MHDTGNFLTYTLPQPLRVVGELLARAKGSTVGPMQFGIYHPWRQ